MVNKRKNVEKASRRGKSREEQQRQESPICPFTHSQLGRNTKRVEIDCDNGVYYANMQVFFRRFVAPATGPGADRGAA